MYLRALSFGVPKYKYFLVFPRLKAHHAEIDIVLSSLARSTGNLKIVLATSPHEEVTRLRMIILKHFCLFLRRCHKATLRRGPDVNSLPFLPISIKIATLLYCKREHTSHLTVPNSQLTLNFISTSLRLGLM